MSGRKTLNSALLSIRASTFLNPVLIVTKKPVSFLTESIGGSFVRQGTSGLWVSDAISQLFTSYTIILFMLLGSPSSELSKPMLSQSTSVSSVVSDSWSSTKATVLVRNGLLLWDLAMCGLAAILFTDGNDGLSLLGF